ncbi:hypothetical protein A1O3_08177 [Capronia epimyces CBS 606.96]|uniref:Uncharacterized protein n=1 Tax=Capronia epimyces CBS 606.96 TaxID=1182542 RepID=W9XHB9_9EURO|nr:uncharacterized protein A1O3_08177 [Capronia epimyces CBS 606.96]EXJ79892.1 hypothetical protein A1O3_08177 [Capronia epimyces CBS 606.96]
MPGYKFKGEGLCDELFAGISQTLDEAGVPSILWSEYLLTLYGVPTVYWSADFIVPDDKISTAYEALREAGFPECSQFADCRLCDKTSRKYWPVPPAHLHRDDFEVISLFKKSETLWNLSSFEVDRSNGELMFASDPLLPHTKQGVGRMTGFAPDLHPVRIPTPAYGTEAVIKLSFRDEEVDYAWDILYGYMAEYVDRSDILDSQKDLKPEFRPLMRWLNSTGLTPAEDINADGKCISKLAMFKKLEDILKSQNELKPPLV